MATVSNQVSRAMSDATLVAELLGRDGEQLERDGPLAAARPRMVAARARLASVERQSRLAVALHALGVRTVHRQAGEELGGHAATPAAVVVLAATARPGGTGLAA